MKFQQDKATLFMPDDRAFDEAAAEVTHLCVGAHPDDLEFMAFHGIEACYGRDDAAFGGIVCTDGGGSARTGVYADYSDEQMKGVRWEEQKAAATVGRYAFVGQLAYPSSDVKTPENKGPDRDLEAVLQRTYPGTVYTHNPADKHSTHVAVCMRVLRVLRALPPEKRPGHVWGCEIWRDLDWLPDAKKGLLDVSRREHLASALAGCFDSQIAGGKRYDLAVAGRRRAQATFWESHEPDSASQVTFAMDLMPLVEDADLTPEAYVSSLIDSFRSDVLASLAPWA